MPRAASPDPAALDRSIAEVLKAVGRETGQLHHAAVRLQTMAGELIDRARLPSGDPLIEEAQALDALAQNLDALSGFLERLGAAAPTSWRLDIADAVQPVFLADLARRLSQQPAHEDASAPTGEFELF